MAKEVSRSNLEAAWDKILEAEQMLQAQARKLQPGGSQEPPDSLLVERISQLTALIKAVQSARETLDRLRQDMPEDVEH